MSTSIPAPLRDEVDYPESDGRPIAETPIHRENLTDLIAMLQDRFDADPLFYVSGNMFVYYEEGNRSRCLAPDVFVARGIPKQRDRNVFKTWEEGKGPDVVIELTSVSTREEDEEDKYNLYENKLKVREYFLFDPRHEYLVPPLRGYRLTEEGYRPIQPFASRLPSEVLGLHLERDGRHLRLYDPLTGRWIPTRKEANEQYELDAIRLQAERQRAEQATQRAEEATQRAEEATRRAEEATRRAVAEAERLRRELDALRGRLGGGDPA